MLKEIRQEIKFILEHPFISLFVIGTITGILPAYVMGFITKIF